MQNRTIKSPYNLNWFTPTAILDRKLTLLTVKDMFKQQLAKCVLSRDMTLYQRSSTINILLTSSFKDTWTFDFSCMVEIEVDNVYN